MLVTVFRMFEIYRLSEHPWDTLLNGVGTMSLRYFSVKVFAFENTENFGHLAAAYFKIDRQNDSKFVYNMLKKIHVNF